MFVLALTPERFAHERFPGSEVRTVRSGPWTATAVISHGGAVCREDGDALEIVETPAQGGRPASGPLLCRLRFDARAGRLSVERPPPSGRQLYWAPTPDGGWLFATRVSTLGQAGLVLEEEPSLLPEVLVYRYVMPPRTLYRHVSVLPYGAGLELQIGGAPVLTPYAPRLARGAVDEAAIGERVAACLGAAIDELAPCRDSLVVLLSGGIDSSMLYKLCQDRFDTPDSYSASNTFGGEDDLEKPYAFSAAAALGARHAWFGVDEAGWRRGFLRATACAEEPIHHLQSVLIHAVVAGARPDGGGVVVNGEGADIVVGEDLQRLMMRADKLPYRYLRAHPLRALLGAAVRMAGRDTSFVEFLEDAERAKLPLDDPDHLLWWIGTYGDVEWVVEHTGASPDAIVSGRRAAIAHLHDLSLLDRVTLMCVVSDTAITQAVWGKLAESAGSRMVYPFCDPQVTNLAFSIPWATKLAEHKRILKLAARRIGVPERILERPKSGFGIHEKHWSRPGGAFDPLVPLAARVVDEAWLRALQTGRSEHAMIFWSLLSYGVWKRLAIDRVPVADLEAELTECEARAGSAPGRSRRRAPRA